MEKEEKKRKRKKQSKPVIKKKKNTVSLQEKKKVKRKKKSSQTKERTTVAKTKKGVKKKKSKGQKKRKKPNKKMEWFLSVIVILLLCLIGFVTFFFLHYSKGEVISASMEPTLGVNDRVIIAKKKEPKRFDMIVFYPPDNDKEKWVKRVIGLPGEQVEYFDDRLYVNGKEVKEPFLDEGKKNAKTKPYTNDFDLSKIPGLKSGEYRIPKGYYLVMGDNRQNSEDSRVIGLIKKDRIEGVVLYRYFPLNKLGSVYDAK